ncbi:hypothetical protein BDR03DRAFT_953032 [Suillus americanus]|nr:hypothetical protein BDR03DRAFT_953032 [Suillus americanus]
MYVSVFLWFPNPSNRLQYHMNAGLPRIGTPEDIANMVSFLTGTDSVYITGQTITIDGGTWMDSSCTSDRENCSIKCNLFEKHLLSPEIKLLK